MSEPREGAKVAKASKPCAVRDCAQQVNILAGEFLYCAEHALREPPQPLRPFAAFAPSRETTTP
jgi:hypothetical protein